jgi:hypothetical protein
VSNPATTRPSWVTSISLMDADYSPGSAAASTGRALQMV